MSALKTHFEVVVSYKDFHGSPKEIKKWAHRLAKELDAEVREVAE